MIEQEGGKMSVREQCRLLNVPRSTVYYTPCGPRASDLVVMRQIDEQYTRTPFYGVERMTACLRRMGVMIGHNRVRRLMRRMGLEAIYPKPRLSVPGGSEHRIDPYLLRAARIERPNQVWSADIMYIRLWRTVKYEEVYLKDDADLDDAWWGLHEYFAFYNRDRPHQALGYRTPAEVHFGVPGEVQRKPGKVPVEA